MTNHRILSEEHFVLSAENKTIEELHSYLNNKTKYYVFLDGKVIVLRNWNTNFAAQIERIDDKFCVRLYHDNSSLNPFTLKVLRFLFVPFFVTGLYKQSRPLFGVALFMFLFIQSLIWLASIWKEKTFTTYKKHILSFIEEDK